MDEYLQSMKTLRSHINDVEDQAAKISVEEEMQITTIQTLTKEIDLAKSETKRLKEDSDVMKNAKGDICSKILERQRKIALLENDSSTLSQTLELIQQEKVNLSTKLVDKRTSYETTEDELGTKLKEQQDWLNKSSSKSGEDSLVRVTCEPQDDAYKNMVKKIDAAKPKFENITQMRSELASERHKVWFVTPRDFRPYSVLYSSTPTTVNRSPIKTSTKKLRPLLLHHAYLLCCLHHHLIISNVDF